MRLSGSATKASLFSATLLLSCPVLTNNANAAQPPQTAPAQTASSIATQAAYNIQPGAMSLMETSGIEDYRTFRSRRRSGGRFTGISCVPYARQVSGIQVAGNAWQWWDHAAGLYARGDQPEAGSVLNFRPNSRMQLGHVAVVRRVVNAREVIVDHANWANGGRITRNIAVVDVSEANNWSAVRVELGRAGDFGSVYPTYGFIYNRPDSGSVLASVARPAPQPGINRITSDLRPVAERPWRIVVEEVAESPGTSRRIDVQADTVSRLR